ncbi:bifunctional 4-hydroxy-2-oxoglutarate aldolase/2-dehydro-3-deoxy-phosphogluconate aldolase [Halobacillus litoralis]|uniref:bifunctional 4-hydroxy-2-oxoglutarate aldolase/2-dehydro-3-deoxy-phosphogluconate aldolase n=1 Tax=Halobacillus litoralis TaxID=45668 RepID=UPI001CD74760|nr:bifunctional 4-hydroxy-2-oxoglutarate aldolase/2-dehydro-3-deoxy-phosphogluconate aldolase [Halobacillus litoralis]MCA0972153.1 bifunctional 4-hydroxy-2-oxoglutarate aldolase/2-dehydro-3-deoxy-phosphogluconate aldolase [Halobacillus litoralis]
MHTYQDVKNSKVIPVIRQADPATIGSIMEALYEGGIRTVELTAETAGIEQLIGDLNKEWGDRMMIGAGTVLDSETARSLIMAGASFIVSPVLDEATVKLCNRYGVPYIPGVFTPTEMVQAYETGAQMVKLFPASSLGPEHIKSIKGPLPQVSVMATGGVNLANMMDYIHHGADAVGVGSQLVNPKLLHTREDFQRLKEEATKYMTKVQELQTIL